MTNKNWIPPALALGALLFAGLAFSDEQMGSMQAGQHGGGMMGGMGDSQMMQAMRDPATMRAWMHDMMGDPQLMASMMQTMQSEMKIAAESGRLGQIYCPMMGFTPENPPKPRPAVPPNGLTPETLFLQTCSQCHALPDPERHTRSEWPGVVRRMQQHMAAGGFARLTPDQADSILNYLDVHAKD